MKTNEIKKGMQVKLRNGSVAVMSDNKRGDTRMVEVKDIVTDAGSIYAHDIISVNTSHGWIEVTHTEGQLRLKAIMDAFDQTPLLT